MKRYVFSSCAAAALSLAVVSAQSVDQTPTNSPVQGNTQQSPDRPRPGTATQPGTQQGTPTGTRSASQSGSSASADNRITVSGCVMRGASAGDYTLGSLSREASDTQARAGVAGSNATGNNSSVGTSGSTPSSYGLMGSSSQNLSQYLGQRVEIVGTTSSGQSGATSTAGSTPGLGNTRGTTGTGMAVEPDAQANRGGSSNSASVSATTAAGATTPTEHLTVVSVRRVPGNCQ